MFYKRILAYALLLFFQASTQGAVELIRFEHDLTKLAYEYVLSAIKDHADTIPEYAYRMSSVDEENQVPNNIESLHESLAHVGTPLQGKLTQAKLKEIQSALREYYQKVYKYFDDLRISGSVNWKRYKRAILAAHEEITRFRKEFAIFEVSFPQETLLQRLFSKMSKPLSEPKDKPLYAETLDQWSTILGNIALTDEDKTALSKEDLASLDVIDSERRTNILERIRLGLKFTGGQGYNLSALVKVIIPTIIGIWHMAREGEKAKIIKQAQELFILALETMFNDPKQDSSYWIVQNMQDVETISGDLKDAVAWLNSEQKKELSKLLTNYLRKVFSNYTGQPEELAAAKSFVGIFDDASAIELYEKWLKSIGKAKY